jgi:hypothetical protein
LKLGKILFISYLEQNIHSTLLTNEINLHFSCSTFVFWCHQWSLLLFRKEILFFKRFNERTTCFNDIYSGETNSIQRNTTSCTIPIVFSPPQVYDPDGRVYHSIHLDSKSGHYNFQSEHGKDGIYEVCLISQETLKMNIHFEMDSPQGDKQIQTKTHLERMK